MIGSSNIDVASVAIWAFWLFFFGLIYYLRREDHREGYPLEEESGATNSGWPAAEKKTYLSAHPQTGGKA